MTTFHVASESLLTAISLETLISRAQVARVGELDGRGHRGRYGQVAR